MKICVLGAGAWGTALAVNAAGRHPVTLWARDAAQAEAMSAARENQRYLPGIALPPSLTIRAGDALAALEGADLAIVATPMAALREQLVLCATPPTRWPGFAKASSRRARTRAPWGCWATRSRPSSRPI